MLLQLVPESVKVFLKAGKVRGVTTPFDLTTMTLLILFETGSPAVEAGLEFVVILSYLPQKYGDYRHRHPNTPNFWPRPLMYPLDEMAALIGWCIPDTLVDLLLITRECYTELVTRL